MRTPAKFEVFHVKRSGWYFYLSGDFQVGPFAARMPACTMAGDVMRASDLYDSDEAFAARQRHQRNEEGDIPDPRGGE